MRRIPSRSLLRMEGNSLTTWTARTTLEPKARRSYLPSVIWVLEASLKHSVMAQTSFCVAAVCSEQMKPCSVTLSLQQSVADASPCVGAAAWWHDWQDDQFQELACALMAGHLIECTGYVTGANFTGFKRFPKNVRTGFPIAEISSDGDVVITKASFFGAEVSVESQFIGCRPRLMSGS